MKGGKDIFANNLAKARRIPPESPLVSLFVICTHDRLLEQSLNS
jgi:hypothetical protein